MQTADQLTAALMQRVIDANGEAFTFETVLGNYETKERQTGEGWQPTDCSSLNEIAAGTEQVRQLGKRFSSLKITYPQKELSAEHPAGNDAERIVLRQSQAVIKVPEDFVLLHSGVLFRRLLSEKWSEQTAELTAEIAANLRRYELRTARMFGDEIRIRLRIESEFASSDIWMLPLSQFGLFPLGWDAEIVGMASDIADSLRSSLQAECGTNLEVRVRRDEQAQCCVIELSGAESD